MSDLSHTGPAPLEHGQIIPAFTLPGTDNLPYSPWDYKQRAHLVLLFLRNSQDDFARTLLRAFADRYKDFREEQCTLLAITGDPVIRNMTTQETLHLPYPLLADPQGTVISRYTLWERAHDRFHPCIVLADRYNAVYQQWRADSEANPLPTLTELLESLQYLNRLCTP
ncbi:MAG TPA: redoxin domain-containing protein [Ktedonobacteraceae bacterium]|jgi:peroxiredoxin|nr:redoxin domain-containing protein [Ktedonobacteraceae bacterium]